MLYATSNIHACYHKQCRRAVGVSPDRSISREGLVHATLDMSIPCTGLLPLLRMDAKDLKKQVMLLHNTSTYTAHAQCSLNAVSVSVV
jgi:hypothetical protein